MGQPFRRIDLNPLRLGAAIRQVPSQNPSWQFSRDIVQLIWEYRGYSLAILLVTVVQEVSALWPVNLFGQLVDRLALGDPGDTVWWFLGASILYPGIVRGNVMLRHKMFYETDLQKRVELTMKLCARGDSEDLEAAGAANSRIVNAVSGITNTTYHVLGSFTPVIIKVIVVSTALIAYNGLLGAAYLVSLIVPTAMTLAFNNALRVLRDSQYSIISQVEGLVIRTITGKRGDEEGRFQDTMRQRTSILIDLVNRSQTFLYIREVALVGSQFLVVFIALAMRDQINMTPGDFTRIIGYTTQVAVAFINAAACLDAVISYSRAYHVYAQAHGNHRGSGAPPSGTSE